MNHADNASKATRRQFLQHGGALAAATVMAGSSAAAVHTAEDHTVRLALIGCGGRGTGAVVNALNTSNQGPISLYAMADLRENAIQSRYDALKKQFEHGVDVTSDRKFLGFDAYKKAIDVLRPGDVALCTTRAYIRPLHVEYAVSKGINVFMEKPFAPDPAGLRKLLKAGEEAEKKGVKIAAGLQCRHSPARAAMIDKIHGGEMGDISYICANRLGGRGWLGNMGQRANNLLDQLNFGRVQLFWVGSGHMVDYLIHQIDECCWLMDDWPISCQGMGGREVGTEDHGQNLDTYSMEFTFKNGKKAFCGFRRAKDAHDEFATFVHGTKRAGQFSGDIHAATVHMYKDLRISKRNIVWKPEPDTKSPWDYEWIHFIDSIRNDKPHNEARRAVYSDYAAQMGRAAVHGNRIVKWDEVLNSQFQFCKNPEALNFDSPPPVLADENGYFPAPVAGEWHEL